jgi:carbon storage regulator CsrA
MLVLTRKHQEKIQIGDDIVITVLKTKGKTVRLGIEAPNSMTVLRGELTFDSPRSGEKSAASKPVDEVSVADSQVVQTRIPRSESSRVLPTLLAGQATL